MKLHPQFRAIKDAAKAAAQKQFSDRHDVITSGVGSITERAFDHAVVCMVVTNGRKATARWWLDGTQVSETNLQYYVK